MAEMKDLIGETIKSFKVSEGYEGDVILITCVSGACFKMFHDQDCCESVSIEDICGDIDDLIGSVVLDASEVASRKDPEGAVKERDSFYMDSFTWTFYKIDTDRGGITIRWYGESNGCYSEAVDFVRIQ